MSQVPTRETMHVETLVHQMHARGDILVKAFVNCMHGE